jgi:hypothetical protein
MLRLRCISVIVLLSLIWVCRSNPLTSGDREDPVEFPKAVRLTDEVEDIHPAWSPDGWKIASERRDP